MPTFCTLGLYAFFCGETAITNTATSTSHGCQSRGFNRFAWSHRGCFSQDWDCGSEKAANRSHQNTISLMRLVCETDLRLPTRISVLSCAHHAIPHGLFIARKKTSQRWLISRKL
eukprot:479688-Pleurochrysis_carterae.AAC.3